MPAAPCTCIAWSAICCTVLGTSALTIERRRRVSRSVLPRVSISCAASRTRCRMPSMSARHFAMPSMTVSRLASGLPKATRDSARAHMSESARSAWPMARMQWWMRPGPSRRCAISKPLPSPQRMADCGTRQSSNAISMWPFGGSASPNTVSGRTSRMPGVSIGTRSMDCCWWRFGFSGSVLPIRIMICVCSEPAPVHHHLRPLMT
mmetsp:Transcript_17591/g.52076  ORF Transcript_17591/g.52076 Transcript_17591/m.52076 type:complete len:206 (+) Transcript_17591:461-1078(+)